VIFTGGVKNGTTPFSAFFSFFFDFAFFPSTRRTEEEDDDCGSGLKLAEHR